MINNFLITDSAKDNVNKTVSGVSSAMCTTQAPKISVTTATEDPSVSKENSSPVDETAQQTPNEENSEEIRDENTSAKEEPTKSWSIEEPVAPVKEFTSEQSTFAEFNAVPNVDEASTEKSIETAHKVCCFIHHHHDLQ